MNVRIELAEEDIRLAIAEFILTHFGVTITTDHLEIEVKSKQNYKSEWEKAAIRVAADVKAVTS